MHNAIFCCKSRVGPIKKMNRTQQLYSVRCHKPVGPEWDDCRTMPPIRAHNNCEHRRLGTMSGRSWGGAEMTGQR